LIEYYSETGKLIGINTNHIVWYKCYEDHTVVTLANGIKMKVWMTEDEFRIALRDVAPAVCGADPEPPKG
jgi:hypothetical protein